jgi:hypothetical protein
MAEHARVTWVRDPTTWVREHALIGTMALPLNRDQNRTHAFHPTLSALRRAANARVREVPILPAAAAAAGEHLPVMLLSASI